jgi:quercetin dioxygenase-like cupin family protein
MTEQNLPVWRFVSEKETEVETLPGGKTHYFHCKPGMVADTNLMFIRVHLEPGSAHPFHYHPNMEEILYIISGSAYQWVEQTRKILKAGDSVYIPAGIVHGTYNAGNDVLDFLAVLSPAKSPGPVTISVDDQEPYKSWKTS